MKKYFIFILLLGFGYQANAQNPKFDKLEVNFAQKHYKRVYRKANRLLDKPEYDFSLIPTYYKSISMFQLCQNGFWLHRHDGALQEAERLFLEVKHSLGGEKIFNAHMYEISWLKEDMTAWAADLKRMGHSESFEEVQAVIANIFDDVPSIDSGNSANSTVAETNTNTTNDSSGSTTTTEVAGTRGEIVESAKSHLGTPYVWAGSSPEGFDCSGFTSFIMKEYGSSLPRRAADQYNSSKKIKQKHVKPGDLVFFNNGSGISHVGIVISNQGEPLKMIHSSSSKGIIITNIDKSEYWTKRLHGFGTYVN